MHTYHVRERPRSGRARRDVFHAACATPSDKAPAASTTQALAAITEADVIAAQYAWGDALVTIATTYDTKGYEEARLPTSPAASPAPTS